MIQGQSRPKTYDWEEYKEIVFKIKIRISAHTIGKHNTPIHILEIRKEISMEK